MQLLTIQLDALRDAPRNANRMAPEKYTELKESIRRFGFLVPLVVRCTDDPDVREVVDGHHRARALRELGIASADALVLEPGDDPRVVALALNRLRGETDLAVASLLIQELLDEGVTSTDLTVTGFSERELSALAAALEQPDPSLDDLGDGDVPAEVGSDVVRPFLLELTFGSKVELAEARKALKKAAGRGGALSDGLLRLVRAE